MIPDSRGMEIVGHILIALLVVLMVFLVVSVILYIIKALGIYTLLKNNGEKDLALLAWIPIVNIYVYSELARASSNKSIRILTSAALTALYILNILLLMLLSELVIITSLIYLAINIVLFGSIVKACSKNIVKHVIIAVFTIGISIPIQIFAFRKTTLIYDEDLILE